MSFTLNANQVPIPTCPATFINPASLTPIVSPALVAGDTGALISKFCEVAARLDAVGRAGGGAYAVTNGLAISAGSGLTLNVAAGQAVMDNAITLPSGGSLTLPDATADLYIWLSQTGVLSSVAGSLTPPAGAQVYLGHATTAAGAISSVDLSGVMVYCSGTLCRKTADTSCPTDAPPSTCVFLVQGNAGVWLWTGTKYVCLSGGRAVLTSAVDGDKTLTTPEASNQLLDFTNSGTAWTGTHKLIVPLEAGRQWTARNNGPGAQSCQVIGSSGTGITIATGKTAIVACDSTNIFRVSADV